MTTVKTWSFLFLQGCVISMVYCYGFLNSEVFLYPEILISEPGVQVCLGWNRTIWFLAEWWEKMVFGSFHPWSFRELINLLLKAITTPWVLLLWLCPWIDPMLWVGSDMLLCFLFINQRPFSPNYWIQPNTPPSFTLSGRARSWPSFSLLSDSVGLTKAISSVPYLTILLWILILTIGFEFFQSRI